MPNKAVFLDRDNTLIHDPGYISRPDQVVLIDGVPEALKRLRDMGYLLVLATNQSAVARGLVSEQGLLQIHQHLQDLLASSVLGGGLDAIYYCPFHPEAIIEAYRCQSELRKPAPGMLLVAAEQLQIDLRRSWCIGDSERDIQAGIAAGCRTIWIGAMAMSKDLDPGPDFIADDIGSAVDIIEAFDYARQDKMDNLDISGKDHGSP